MGSWSKTAVGFFTWTVPPGITTVDVLLGGASGGFSADGIRKPGPGAVLVYWPIDVTPGEVLRFYVGGQGGAGTSTTAGAGGYNGGGAGGVRGGGGGGASEVRRAPYTLADRILVAGGGGGAADGTEGGQGGVFPGFGAMPGEDGGGGSPVDAPRRGGGGGVGAAGGVGGAGSVANGGDGDDSAGGEGAPGAGGGGGGYFGGGGGGADGSASGLMGGGGGGGSFGTVGLVGVDPNPPDNGYITVTWDGPDPEPSRAGIYYGRTGVLGRGAGIG